MFKQNDAITLIAIIITIIVLLILAGVVINMTLGNDGIISKAQGAVEMYKNATEKEEYEIAKAENKIDEYSAFTRAGGSNINYSTSEKDTGLKWIDGSTIYQKVFTGLNISCGTTANEGKLTGCVCEDADKLIHAELLCWDGVLGNNYTYIPLAVGINGTHEIRFVTTAINSSMTITTIIAQYTKTTDQASN